MTKKGINFLKAMTKFARQRQRDSRKPVKPIKIPDVTKLGRYAIKKTNRLGEERAYTLRDKKSIYD